MTYRILLIEDDRQICEILTDYLTSQKEDEFQVSCAKDGAAGYERIVEGQYDLVLLDIMLPEMDEFALCTQYTEKILENVNTMNAIVDEMLEFTGRRQIGSH